MIRSVLAWWRRNARSRPSWLWVSAVVFLVTGVPTVALGHERFVKHDVLRPFPHEFFAHVDGNVLTIAMRVCVAMIAVLFLWFHRHGIQAFVETRVLRHASDRDRALVARFLRFVTDQPLDAPWFRHVG